VVELVTAAGPATAVYLAEAVDAWITASDRVVGPVVADVLVLHTEEEVLMNDVLAERLGIVILAPASGR
jgi:hypothetical protein